MEKLLITPKTKIYDLLEAYPKLEDVLIEMTPQFKKLKNPILRKTVTRITNLNQAASIGGLNVEELVNRLRREAGQDRLENFESEKSRYNIQKPEWYSGDSIVTTIDIRDMLHEGEQPVGEVLAALKKLNSGEILKVVAPFLPAPLIDKSLSLQYDHWVEEAGTKEFCVYFHGN